MVVRGLSLYRNPYGVFRAFADEVSTCKILGGGLNAWVDLRMNGNFVCHVYLLKKTINRTSGLEHKRKAPTDSTDSSTNRHPLVETFNTACNFRGRAQ